MHDDFCYLSRAPGYKTSRSRGALVVGTRVMVARAGPGSRREEKVAPPRPHLGDPPNLAVSSPPPSRILPNYPCPSPSKYILRHGEAPTSAVRRQPYPGRLSVSWSLDMVLTSAPSVSATSHKSSASTSQRQSHKKRNKDSEPTSGEERDPPRVHKGKQRVPRPSSQHSRKRGDVSHSAGQGKWPIPPVQRH